MNPAKRFRSPVLATTLASVLLLASPDVLASPSSGATLCTTGETTFFSCRLAHSTKIAALCGHAGEPRPWLQYRIGVPGRPAELLVPKSIDDPDMTSTFFADGPASTRDHSSWDVGVWFQNVDTLYELQTLQEHEHREGDDTSSAIIVWRSARPEEVGKFVHCAGTSPSAGLLAAHRVIESMSPPGHGWHVSPWDGMSQARARDAARRPSARGEGAASAASGASAAR